MIQIPLTFVYFLLGLLSGGFMATSIVLLAEGRPSDWAWGVFVSALLTVTFGAFAATEGSKNGRF